MQTFHRHSTLCGFLLSGLLAAVVGYATRWQPWFIFPLFFFGMLLFPRLFYGLHASATLDKTRVQGPYRQTLPNGSMLTPASRAYVDAQAGYDSAGNAVTMDDVREAIGDE